MTKDQMDFIRARGITMCPPGPVTTMAWHRWSDQRASEAELVSYASFGLPELALKAGPDGFANLSSASGRMGRKGKRCRS
jgi:hypothetical protein